MWRSCLSFCGICFGRITFFWRVHCGVWVRDVFLCAGIGGRRCAGAGGGDVPGAVLDIASGGGGICVQDGTVSDEWIVSGGVCGGERGFCFSDYCLCAGGVWRGEFRNRMTNDKGTNDKGIPNRTEV